MKKMFANVKIEIFVLHFLVHACKLVCLVVNRWQFILNGNWRSVREFWRLLVYPLTVAIFVTRQTHRNINGRLPPRCLVSLAFVIPR